MSKPKDVQPRWRVRIVDVEAQGWRWNGIPARTPPVSRPHVGKEGWAEQFEGSVKITLDDGAILYGYECWWVPV